MPFVANDHALLPLVVLIGSCHFNNILVSSGAGDRKCASLSPSTFLRQYLIAQEIIQVRMVYWSLFTLSERVIRIMLHGLASALLHAPLEVWSILSVTLESIGYILLFILLEYLVTVSHSRVGLIVPPDARPYRGRRLTSLHVIDAPFSNTAIVQQVFLAAIATPRSLQPSQATFGQADAALCAHCLLSGDHFGLGE